jgi:hypothetical protein
MVFKVWKGNKFQYDRRIHRNCSERYIELYENILGEKFVKADINIDERIKNVLEYLANR